MHTCHLDDTFRNRAKSAIVVIMNGGDAAMVTEREGTP
jgi:hypothetical protein